jgi:lysophospholipid acyltransferase
MRLVIMFFIGIVYRIKFYTGWAFTQAAANCSGISYDKNGTFTEVDIGSAMYEVEYNPRLKTEHWNASVQKWLKVCFYEPVSALYPKSQVIPTLVVFLFSAVWHGIYFTYYIGFLEWALVANISKFLFKASWKFGKLEGTPLLKGITWVTSNLFMNYIGMHIVMLNFELGIAYYNSVYWYGTIVMIAVHIFFSITGWGQRPSKPKTVQPTNGEPKSKQT